MFQRIYLEKAIKESPYKSKNGFLGWCKRHNVKIFHDEGSRKPYILEFEFAAALEAQSRIYIQKRYWVSTNPDAISSDLWLHSSVLATNDIRKNNNERNFAYLGKNAKRFLSSLTQTNPEL